MNDSSGICPDSDTPTNRRSQAGDKNMPSIKQILKTRVTGEVKAAFSARAAAHSLSEAALLETIVASFLRLDHAAPPAHGAPCPGYGGARTRDVHVRLLPSEYEALERLSAMRHWKRSTYLGHLIRTHLNGQPRFSDDEMLALRHIVAQLSALGRNVNQIARALGASPAPASLAMALPLRELKALIDEERAGVKDLIRSNLTSWSAVDER